MVFRARLDHAKTNLVPFSTFFSLLAGRLFPSSLGRERQSNAEQTAFTVLLLV